ncbi:MAG: YybH family protein [Candidatus Hydrothermarchaeales archaeon]
MSLKTQDEEIEDFVRNYFKKFDTRKVPSVMKFYSSEASVVIGGGRYSGKDEVKGFNQEFFKRIADTKHELKNIKVEKSGFEVIVTLDWRLTAYVKKIAKSVTILGSDKFWLLYEEDNWQIVEHDIFMNLTKTLLRHGPLNFLNLIKAKDQFEF